MKTKVNEIPLVGPKGRKELIGKTNELEKKVTSLINNIISSPAKEYAYQDYYVRIKLLDCCSNDTILNYKVKNPHLSLPKGVYTPISVSETESEFSILFCSKSKNYTLSVYKEDIRVLSVLGKIDYQLLPNGLNFLGTDDGGNFMAYENGASVTPNYITVNGKCVEVELEEDGETIANLTVSTSTPPEGVPQVVISEEDMQYLIGRSIG